MNKDRSIFADEFYGPLLAQGTVSCEGSIPGELLEAMAIMISDTVCVYMPSRECEALVALTVVGLRDCGWVVSPPELDLHNSPIKEDYLCKKRILPVLEDKEHLSEVM